MQDRDTFGVAVASLKSMEYAMLTAFSRLRPLILIGVFWMVTGSLRSQDGGFIEEKWALRRALRPLSAIQVDGDGARLKGKGGEAIRVTGIMGKPEAATGASLRLEIGDLGRFLIPASYFGAEGADGPAIDIAAAARRARPLIAADATPRIDFDPLIGWFVLLPDDTGLVTAELGLLRRDETSTKPASETRLPVDSVAALLDGMDLPEESRFAIRSLLGRLGDGREPADENDHLSPDLARAMARTGWLERTLGDGAEVRALRSALIAATQPAAASTWSRNDSAEEPLRFRRVANPFGLEGADLLIGDRLVRYRRVLGVPTFMTGVPQIDVVVEPGEGDQVPRRMAAFHAGRELAHWSPEAGLEADLEAWNRVFRPAAAEAGRVVLADALPPHLVWLSPEGMRLGLAAAGGLLLTPRSSGPDAIETFLADAARCLPGPADLDLIGERLFRYVDDSPDPRRPWLIGVEGARGEIHQTVAETLENSAEGVCRGDCDDLAEVYQVIATRQGRLAHIMNLPGHNATAFAELADESATVYVLQTGAPFRFRAKTLPLALKAAYEEFGHFENFDPDQCPISLRFSGENTRSAWMLGWRIFRDRDYAATMIDVQRDWHFHTYSRAIAKMEALIAGGDEDPANYRELAGLAERTGRHDEAARRIREARSRSGPEALSLMSRLIVALDHEGKKDELRTAIEEAKAGIEKLPVQSPDRLAHSIQIAEVAAVVEDPEPLLPILLTEVVPIIGSEIEGLSFITRIGRMKPTDFGQDPELIEVRGLMLQFATTGMEILRRLPRADLRDTPDFRKMAYAVETYFGELAFYDPDIRGGGLSVCYGLEGNFAAALLGDTAMDALLADVVPATTAPPETQERRAGMPGFLADLPYVAASPEFWAGRIDEVLDRRRKTFDRARFDRLFAAFERAGASTAWSALDRSRFDETCRRIRLIAALLRGDEAGIREQIEHVRQQGDKRLTDGTAELVGMLARFVAPKDFDSAVRALLELDNRPLGFTIAWEAARNDAPEAALRAAGAAILRWPDDAALREEEAFMSGLLKPGR